MRHVKEWVGALAVGAIVWFIVILWMGQLFPFVIDLLGAPGFQWFVSVSLSLGAFLWVLDGSYHFWGSVKSRWGHAPREY